MRDVKTAAASATAGLSLLLATGSLGQVSPVTHRLGIDLTLSELGDYGQATAIGLDLGMQQVGLHLTWSRLEPVPGVYDLSLLETANGFYPTLGLAVDLNLDPIETHRREMPADLQALPFADPLVVGRFNTLLDSVFSRLPQLDLSSLVIGSEIDAHLGADSLAWDDYSRFLVQAADHARTLRPGLPIATECTLQGLTGPAAVHAWWLNQSMDLIGVSYYPLNSDFTMAPPAQLETDLAPLLLWYPEGPLCFFQLGYASSPVCNSSQAAQRDFVELMFQFWDAHAVAIHLLDFTWLHDLDPAALEALSEFYGIDDPAFLEFLRTLGLRSWNGMGSDKTALEEVSCQANRRGFNDNTCNLPVQYRPARPAMLQLIAGPNPFNPRTSITATLPTTGILTLAVYDLRGGRVCTLARGIVAAGTREWVWDGRADDGRPVAGGVYIVRLESPAAQGAVKLLYLP